MIYQLLIRLLSPLILVQVLLDAYQRKGGWQFIKQRCGFGYTHTHSTHDYWLHCASVGEVNAALPLLKKLIDKKVIVTTNTPTGKQFLHKHLPNTEHAYCPLDWPYAIKRFLTQSQPKNLWVLETEIWPNLYRLSYSQTINIQIINGRLSKKTLKAPKWLKQEYHSSLQLVDHVYAKSSADKQRFIDLGIQPEKVVTLGNIKFAHVIDLPSQPAPIKWPFIFLASSHEDEELAIAKLWQKIKIKKQLKEGLVIAPRHPKRCQQLAKDLAQKGLSVGFYGQPINHHTDANYDVLLIDEIGQLLPFYEHAKLVIIGGSFVNKGGQNLLEPCAYGKAVLTGPDMSNFQEEAEILQKAHAVIQCKDLSELTLKVRRLLESNESRQLLGENAKNTVQKQSTVLEKYQRRLNI